MILADYLCTGCDSEQEHMVASPAPDIVECEFCGEEAHWLPTPIMGRVATSVVRGPVAKPDSPMYLDTRQLGEGMPMAEFKEKRRKLYAERRHKEWKRGD